MAGQERNLEILETCIKSLLDEINHFQPHLFRAVCKLIPEVISKANWLKELPVNALRHSFISEIALRISNTMKDRDIFLMSINKCFPCDISDDDPQYDPGFLHQIKCQIRMKNREVLSSDIDKLMELKKCINSHNITVIYGPTCSGKTTAIDILVKSINSYVSSSQTPRFETKNRGTIDVLKTLSNERKSQFPLEIQFGKEDFRRILLKKINLANFTDLELNNQRLINGNKLPNALSSIIDPLVKLQKFDKFQIWICVETDEENVNKDISALASYLEDSVKLIFEVVTYKPLKDVELQNYHGIVHFPSLSNINDIILEQHLKSLLTRKVITYYGCKYLLKVALQMFTDLCKSFKLYLEISQHAGLDIYFVKQSLEILEILLLENQDLFIDQESINSLEDRFNTFLSFSIIQGSRGVLYTILIEKRIMSHEEYEQILRNSLGILCSEIADMKHEYYSSSLFGLTIDMDEICLKPFSIVKGCHLSSFDSCADGVAKYLLTLLMKYSKSIYLNGPDNRIDSFTNLLRFNKRLHLNDSSVFSLMRQSLYDNKKPFWDILSNEDPLFNISESRNIILLENFLNDSNFFNKIHSLLQFSLEHGLIYDLNDNLTFFNEISLDRLILIVTNNNESHNLFNMEDPKWCRWFTIINIVDPHINEAPNIFYKEILPWINKIPKQTPEFSKIFAKKISTFIIDVGTTIERHTRTDLISAVCNNRVLHSFPPQQTWSRLIQITKSVISMSMDLFVELFRKFEKLYPINLRLTNNYSDGQLKDELAKTYKKSAVRVRIIRYLIFVVSRFMIDPIASREQRDYSMSIIIQYLNTHFFQDLSFEMNEILFKNCPISVESYNEIIMLPSRICDESFEVTNQINNKYYQPIVEPHCQKMLEAAVNNICKINSISKHLEKSFYLKGFIKTGIFLKDLMKMYKHFCQYSTSNSALFIESSSSLITGLDWGIFLSELIEAIHIPFVTSDKNAINDFYKSLNLAMIKAADENQKVVFHLDSSVSCFKSELITTLMNLLQQDSITTIFQIFRKYFDNDQSVIKLKSNENARQSRASLENIKKNLKILITVNRTDLDINYNIKVLSDWFMMKSHKYIVLEAHNVEMYRESLDNMISVRLQSISKHYRYLADAHLYFEQYFTRFHMKSQVNGHHLQLAASLYNYLYDIFYNKRHSKICQFELAIKSVTNAEQQIEKLKAKIDVLETNLQSLNEEINVSSSQVKNMKENYGLALNQCRKQENLIADLTGPLNELKEKSKSNLNEVSPTYMAALETIRNLDPGAVEEIKTYIKPPQIVRDLVEIIFYLLGYETNWEEIKEIMVRINLYEDLLYFDKDHIDDKRYSFLLKKLSDRNLDSEALVNISRAAASLSGWLHAILKYSSLSREINPQLGQLLSVQDKVNIAQSELGKMKVRTDMMRQDLEAKLNEHKELLSRKKVLVDHIRDIKYKINSGKNLLSDIRVYCDDWNNQLSELQQSLQNLPNEIIVFIIFNIYLSCIPFSLRQNIFNEFQQLYEIDIKKSDQLELFEENELRNLVDYHQWSSLMKLHIDNASFIASILCCPYISFLEFGSIILIHCHNNGVDNFAEILNSILKSDTVTTMHSNAFGLEHNESIEIIDYIDCAFNDHEAVDKKLEHYITMNIILLIDNIELLSELGPCFQFILYGSITKICFDVHPGFRLVLLTREMYSSTDTLDGYFSSSKLLHYELSLSSKDVQDFIHTLCVKICQPKLFERFQRLNKQIYETNHLSQLEKNVILNLAVECMSKSVQMEFPTIDQEAASIDMQPSILNIRNFHSTILSTDSKLLDFDSTNSAMKKKHKSIIESNEKFYYISEPVCLLLKTFEMFPFEIEIHKKIANKYTFSLNEIIDEMKLQIEKEVSSITVHETVDAEISDEFLQKLYKSTLATIIIGFDAKLDSQKLIEYTVKFCIDTITIDAENNEILSENEKNFIKYALLCQDFEQLLVENSQNSLDFIHDHTNKKISKDTLHLSLVVETNLASLHGLSKSIVDNEELWKEYFKFPFLKSTRMPGFSIGSQPELLQKSIVWRLLNPIKTKEIYSSIIAHVFGEDILSVSINRIETLRNYITKCSPLKPLLIFTPGNTIDCTDNPLEILENHHRIVGNSTKSVIINCASESDKSVDNFSSIYHLVTEPTWIILLNAHLFTNECGLLNFYNEIMKKLWRKFSNQLKNAIHPQCKMFVIFEKSNNLNLSGILLESTYLFICRPSVSFSGCDIVHGKDQKLEKQISLKAVDNIYRGLIKTEFFRQIIFGNNLDIKIVETICSNINPSFEQIRYIFKLIFDNKILSDNGRKVFNDILLNLSEPIKEFLNGTLSDIAIARIIDDHKNNQCLSVFSQNCEASSALKLIDGDVIIDQHLIESTKSRLTDVYQQLNEIINIDLLGEFSVNQFYIKKLSTSIFHMILNLPIWFVRSMSNTRFDSRISSSDINTIKYQYFISNSKLPIKLSNDNINNLSEWLDSIEQIVIDLKKLIMTYDDQLMKTVITKITKNLNTE